MSAPRLHGAATWSAIAFLLACAKSDAPVPGPHAAAALTVVDGGGDTVLLRSPATRVVSLMPSGAEIVIALGEEKRLVGRTDYDRQPSLRGIPSVGGGLDPSLERLVSLRPDVVLYWARDHSGLRSRLAAAGVAAYGMATRDTGDAFRTIQDVGALLGRASEAAAIAQRLRAELDSVRASVRGLRRPSVFYVVSTRPPMTAGRHTFIAQVIGIAGGVPALPDAGGDWPQVSLEELARVQPDIVVLPSETASGARARDLRRQPAWRALAAVRDGRIVEVPEDLVNRPGPRLADAARVMAAALHRGTAERASTTSR